MGAMISFSMVAAPLRQPKKSTVVVSIGTSLGFVKNICGLILELEASQAYGTAIFAGFQPS